MGVVERGRLPPSVARVLAWGRASALRVHVESHDLLGAARSDPAARAAASDLLDGPLQARARRSGVRRAACPAAANLLLVIGPLHVTRAADVVDTYHAMPHPKYVVLVDAVPPDADVGLPVDLLVAPGGIDGTALLGALAGLQATIGVEDTAARWQAGPERPEPHVRRQPADPAAPGAGDPGVLRPTDPGGPA